MTWTIRDVRTNEKIVETEYSRHSSAVRMFAARTLTPQTAYISDDNWRERESKREKLINIEQFGLTAIPDHFLHISTKSSFSDFLISYTESPVKGSKNLQAAGRKVGRYLKEFYPDLDSEKIEKLSHEMAAVLNKLPVDFITKAADIGKLYSDSHDLSGMSSCMAYKTSQWGLRLKGTNTPVHPTEAYGSGELAIAVVRNDKGQPTARALVWMEKKRYGRFYGPDATKLKTLLQSAGYVEDSFKGAPLKMIELEGSTKSRIIYAVPYIDRDRNVYLDDDGQLRIGNGKGCQESGTSGSMTFIQYVSEVTGEKLANSSAARRVMRPDNGRECYISRKLEAEESVTIQGNQYAKVNYPEGDEGNDTWFKIEGEKTFVPKYAADNFYYKSIISNKYIATNQEIGLSSGGFVTVAEFVEHCERCEMNGGALRREDMTLMPHGRYWSRNARDRYAERIDGVWTSKYHTAPSIEIGANVA